MNNRTKISVGACGLLVFATMVCPATTLTPNTGPTNDTSGYAPSGFRVLADSDSVGSGQGLSITLNSWVLSGDTANPLGGLTFLYQVEVTAAA
jgi:hypothetical protein